MGQRVDGTGQKQEQSANHHSARKSETVTGRRRSLASMRGEILLQIAHEIIPFTIGSTKVSLRGSGLGKCLSRGNIRFYRLKTVGLLVQRHEIYTTF